LQQQSLEVASASLARLYQSAKELLRTGTPENTKAYMTAMLEKIRGPMMTHIKNAHESDAKEIEKFDKELDAIADEITGFKDKMGGHTTAVEEKAAKYEQCRAEQKELCEGCGNCTEQVETCETECEITKADCNVQCEVFKIEDTAWPDKEKYDAATNTTTYIWKGGEVAERYIERCEEHIIERKHCNGKKVACDELCDEKNQKAQECDDLLRKLEAASCAVASEYTQQKEALYNKWDSKYSMRQAFCDDLPALVKDRETECYTLTRVECLLNKTSKDPCEIPEKEVEKCKDQDIDCKFPLECGPKTRPNCATEPIPFPCDGNMIDGQTFRQKYIAPYAEHLLTPNIPKCFGEVKCVGCNISEVVG